MSRCIADPQIDDFGSYDRPPVSELVLGVQFRDAVVDFDVKSVLVFREFDLWYRGFPALLRSSFNCGGMIVTRRKFEGHLVKVKP